MSLSLDDNDGSLRCGVPITDTIEGDRTYVLYRPNSACHSANEGDILPLVIAIHCYGGSTKTMLFWTKLAEKYNFVLAIPEGKYNSFNAKACCGRAQQEGVDDVGFLQAIIQNVVQQQDDDGAQVMKEFVYAVGWSNGAYLATYAAHLFRAIAPISGFQVDPYRQNNLQSVGLFQHHAVDDPFVRIGGCCSNNASMPSCCCQLDQFSPQCYSVQDHFAYWRTEVNHCQKSSDVASTAVASMKRTELIVTYTSDSITCWSATGCLRNATYCEHTTGGHFNRPSLQQAFPMMDQVAEFFARDACRGRWLVNRCFCDNPSFSGLYCLSSAASTTKQTESSSELQDNFAFSPLRFALAILFLFCLVWRGRAMFLRQQRERQAEQRYQAVATIELKPSSRQEPPRRRTP